MKTLLYLFILLAIGGLVYAGYYFYNFYQTSDYEEAGFFICNEDKTTCEQSLHIHAHIDVIACGTEVTFEKEKGNSTTAQHTHKEANLIHWHSRERVDPTTREPLDPTPRMLKSFFEAVEYTIPESCNEKPATITLKVNGVEEPQKLDYVWKDDDKLEVVIE